MAGQHPGFEIDPTTSFKRHLATSRLGDMGYASLACVVFKVNAHIAVEALLPAERIRAM
ncbi:MAG: hypothetical protein QF921_00080 [Pseudomonadales bacterium]|jgi:hypothetical protein|nr:hypothetical protein [Pseudomonadales bacterium]MDP6472538.1 hypothetical protein [Pseudomonadales bacterium]MDP6829019.1 hypothetical protein [Pseudomonadales bacterium]MDP6969914.1 hypothetical protein [Pseudomonadales bacterium]|tara:strand:+ start:7827 stop:8003 length:177 start_codon:yes stop_codon:yes gene_type:complete